MHAKRTSNKTEQVEIIFNEYRKFERACERYASKQALDNAEQRFIDACEQYGFDVKRMRKLITGW